MLIRIFYGCFFSLIIMHLNACSIKRFALRSVADALAQGGSSFSKDEDEELIAQATPFALKTFETLIEELPDHAPLLRVTCQNFTQYAYAFVLSPSKYAFNMQEEQRMAKRAKKLFMRAYQYCLQALEIEHPGFLELLKKDKSTLSATHPLINQLQTKDVPTLYWLVASLTLAITAVKDEVDQIGHFVIIDPLIYRAIQLDPGYDYGSLYEFLISFEARSEAMGGHRQKAKDAFKQALQYSQSKKAAPFVNYAESICIDEQNKKEFLTLLEQALAVDIHAHPQFRIANIVAQKRAQYLKSHVDDYFIGE